MACSTASPPTSGCLGRRKARRRPSSNARRRLVAKECSEDLSIIATATVPEAVVQYLDDEVPHRGPKPSHAAQKVVHGPHLSPLEILIKRAMPSPVPASIARGVKV